jgi:hypothetical protein
VGPRADGPTVLAARTVQAGPGGTTGISLAVHLVRVRRAMRDHAHDDEMRQLHKLRESRGF